MGVTGRGRGRWATGRDRRAGKGQEWGGEHGGIGGEGETRRVRLGGGNREGEMGKGAGRGDGEGLMRRERQERGQRGEGEEGQEERGLHRWI